jgi:hypothetical protein
MSGITLEGKLYMIEQERAFTRERTRYVFSKASHAPDSGQVVGSLGWFADTHRGGAVKEFLASGAASRLQLEQLPGSMLRISIPRRGSLEAPQVCGVEEPLLPEPLRVEGRATQGQGALERQKGCHPRLHKAARIRALGVCAEISNTPGRRAGGIRGPEGTL